MSTKTVLVERPIANPSIHEFVKSVDTAMEQLDRDGFRIIAVTTLTQDRFILLTAQKDR